MDFDIENDTEIPRQNLTWFNIWNGANLHKNRGKIHR